MKKATGLCSGKQRTCSRDSSRNARFLSLLRYIRHAFYNIILNSLVLVCLLNTWNHLNLTERFQNPGLFELGQGFLAARYTQRLLRSQGQLFYVHRQLQ
mmetsp:Transcript_10289/g.20323  ORF Transcript_10289/g.20323 Transcript_10289/m.20323 type:complete len:99 (-) Transcript_10289:1675-1971(-)